MLGHLQRRMAEQGLRKEASVPQVWKHAIEASQERREGPPGDQRIGGTSFTPEERAALLIGRRWRARAALRTALSRSRLIERLQLESSVTSTSLFAGM